MPIVNYRLSHHAELSMMERGIPRYVIDQVIDSPEQTVPGDNGCTVCQTRFEAYGKLYLIRVVVNFQRSPVEVLTVYRTTKIDKYWVTVSEENDES